MMKTECRNYEKCLMLFAIDVIANVGRSSRSVRNCDTCNACVPEKEGGEE